MIVADLLCGIGSPANRRQVARLPRHLPHRTSAPVQAAAALLIGVVVLVKRARHTALRRPGPACRHFLGPGFLYVVVQYLRLFLCDDLFDFSAS